MTWESRLAVQYEHWDATLEGSTSEGVGPIRSGHRDPAGGNEPTITITGMEEETALPMADIDDTMVDLPAVGGDDASLVARVLDKDSDAMAEMYDRYADRINTMCTHMLRDADEGADVCGQVFLTAFQRLHQLRDPAKLRPWLYAIARNEVYRRSRDRARVRPMQEVDDMKALSMDPTEFESAGPDATAELPKADPAELAALVQAAAGGLDDRDRMVLELNLTQGLAGEDLADALGVKGDNAYQMTHRMKERLERSMSALLVVSAGRDQCGDLEGVAKKWDGTYDVLWRKRFARHVDGCDRCQKMKAKLPKAVLSGAALSQAAQAALLAAPISVRDEVLGQGAAVVASASGKPWSSSGFPPLAKPPRKVWKYAVGAVLAAALAVVLAEGLGNGELLPVDSTDSPDVSTPSSVVTTSPPTTVPGTVPPTTGAPVPSTTVPGASTTTTTPRGSATTTPGATTTVPSDGGTTTTTITEGVPDPPQDPKYETPPQITPINPPSLSIPMPSIYLPPIYLNTTTTYYGLY